MSLPIVPLPQIQASVTEAEILLAVRNALIAQAEGMVNAPLPGQLLFSEPHGDCHIKYGHIQGSDSYVIKVASGFYDNPKSGLPVTSGLMLVLDARTGYPVCLLDDQGWLTNQRTAAAGVLAAQAGQPDNCHQLGIIGAGEQGYLQASWTAKHLGIGDIVIWARRPEQAEKLCHRLREDGFQAQPLSDIEDLLKQSRLVITTTPSKSPLFRECDVQPGTHIVAMGCDSPGKSELPPELFARAARILTDSNLQCLDHGDFGNAVRAGHATENLSTELGSVLQFKEEKTRNPDDITIADLTGLAAQDIAVADLVRSKLKMP